MAFKSWRNYIEMIRDDKGEVYRDYNDQEIYSSSSQSSSSEDGDDDDDEDGSKEDDEIKYSEEDHIDEGEGLEDIREIDEEDEEEEEEFYIEGKPSLKPATFKRDNQVSK